MSKDNKINPDSNEKEPTPPFKKEPISPPGLETEMIQKPRYHAETYQAADKLNHKVALITGGDSGIGRATAFLFARENAKIAITCLKKEMADAEQLQNEIYQTTGQTIKIIPGDIRDSDFCKNLCQKVHEHFGQLDILVNNAAFQEHIENFEDLTIEHWDRTLKTNIYGYFYMAKAALPFLKEGSTIINVGSITGFEGSAGLIDYSTSKGAIHAFTKSLAQNLVKKGIRVNGIAPGPIWTPLNPAEKDHKGYKNFGDDQPYKRPGQPEEIAPAMVFLASNADSSYISGEIISILGGQTISS